MLLKYLCTIAVLTAVTVAEAYPGHPVMFTAEDGRSVPGPNCDCYVVSGPEPGYFQHYRFWDFRSVPLNPALAKDYQFYPRVNANDAVEVDNAQPILLKDTPFANDWVIQDWHRNGSRLFPITIVNSDKNVFITKSASEGDSTFMALRNTRLERYSSTAEIESSSRDILHCSFRVRLRLLGKGDAIMSPPTEEQLLFGDSQTMIVDPESLALVRRNARRHPPPNGACAGIFTYYSTTSESDIEILTGDPPNRVHYANQPDYDPILDRVIPGASLVKDIPVPWTSWATHRLDWFSGISRWYVENEPQATMTYSVPFDPSMLIVNLWSDGGLWSGNLTVGESVHLGIEWIELAYNVSGSAQVIKREGHEDNDGDAEVHILEHPEDGRSRRTDAPGLLNSVEEQEVLSKRAKKECNVICRVDDVRHYGIPEIV